MLADDMCACAVAADSENSHKNLNAQPAATLASLEKTNGSTILSGAQGF